MQGGAYHTRHLLGSGDHLVGPVAAGDDPDGLCLTRREVVREGLQTSRRFGPDAELLQLVEPYRGAALIGPKTESGAAVTE